jgi:hypothetical protein
MVSGKQSLACKLLLTINRLALVAIYEQAGSLGGYLLSISPSRFLLVPE